MGQNHALVQVWGALFRNGAVAEAKRMFLASGDNKWDEPDEWAGPGLGGARGVLGCGPYKTISSTVERLSS